MNPLFNTAPMNSIFDPAAYQQITDRLNRIEPETKRLWGKMSAAQMLWHCQFPIQLAIKNKKPSKRPKILMQLLFKKSMYNDKLWRKNLPTLPLAKATEEKNFEEELNNLRTALDALHQLKNRKTWNPHPIFGAFTPEQWGQFQYKHLDHHLRQFGL